MMGWLIALGIVFLLAVLPIGVRIRYDSEGILVRVIAGPVKITVFPLPGKKKKDKKKKPKKKTKEAAAEEENLPKPPQPPKTKKKKKPKEEKPQPSTNPPEEQIPGQDNVMNHPEYLPEEMRKAQENTNAAEELDSEEQRGTLQNVHHSTGDDTEGENTEPEGAGEGNETAGTGENETQTLQNITSDTEIVQELPKTTDNIWERALIATEKLNLFFQNWNVEDLENGNIPSEALQNAHNNAINAAADLERIMINVKKHNA